MSPMLELVATQVAAIRESILKIGRPLILDKTSSLPKGAVLLKRRGETPKTKAQPTIG